MVIGKGWNFLRDDVESGKGVSKRPERNLPTHGVYGVYGVLGAHAFN
jgi:hypothetical protein